jgi:hypothetical protein
MHTGRTRGTGRSDDEKNPGPKAQPLCNTADAKALIDQCGERSRIAGIICLVNRSADHLRAI